MEFAWKEPQNTTVKVVCVLERMWKGARLATLCYAVCRYVLFTCHSFRQSSFPLRKRVLHRVRSTAFSFNFQYHLFSLKSTISCSHLLPRLPRHIYPSLYISFNNILQNAILMQDMTTLHMWNKNFTAIQAVMYTTYCNFYTSGPRSSQQ